MAEKIGVSDKTVSKWETAKGYPDISLLEPIAGALGVSMTKQHYISFIAALSSDKIQMIKLYLEGNAEARTETNIDRCVYKSYEN